MAGVFVASYILVLQALIGAFALGAAVASPMLDVFGNPLCITSSDSTKSWPDNTRHSAVPNCCTIACNMFAPVTVDGRTPSSLVNQLPFAAEKPTPAFDSVEHILSPERNPGSPRSPPLIAS